MLQTGRSPDGDDLPPYQDDLLKQQGYDGVPPCEGQWGPYLVTMTPQGRVWTRTYTCPDGTVITEVCYILIELAFIFVT